MATPKTITSTVAFVDPQNNVVASGILVLDLSQPSLIIAGGGQVAPMRVTITLTAAGLIPGGTTIFANDQLSPSGTSYRARLFTNNNLLAADFGLWVISGTSPIDLSQEAVVQLSPTVSVTVPVSPFRYTGPNMQYVAWNGNDSNDGLSWGSAKLTVMAAYDALPSGSSGGIIYISNDGSQSLGVTANSYAAGTGIWLLGNTDPHFSDTIAAAPTGLSRTSNVVTATFSSNNGSGTGTITAGGINRTTTAALAIAASPTGAVRDAGGFYSIITTSAAHGMQIGWQAVISGVTDTTFNGTYKVISISNTTTFVVRNPGTPNATSGSGTVTGNAVTVTVSAAQSFYPNQWVTISGVTDTSFNGTFQLQATQTTTSFVWWQSGANATSGTGSIVGGHSYAIGRTITVAGAVDTSFNGAFTVSTVPSSTTITYAQTAVNATSGLGTVLPGGFRLGKPVNFMGVGGGGQAGANPHYAGRTPILAGSGTDNNKPAVWISGYHGGLLHFENLAFFYPARAIVIGEDSNNLREHNSNPVGNVAGGSQTGTFYNVGVNPNAIAGNGPTIDITGQTFWVWFEHCGSAANSAVLGGAQADMGAAILIEARYNDFGQPSLIYFRDCNIAGGPIKIYGGQAAGLGLYRILNLNTESISGAPGVWITGEQLPVTQGAAGSGSPAVVTSGNSAVFVDSMSHADSAGTSPAVQVDGPNTPPEIVVVSNLSGGSVLVGPMTVLGGVTNAGGQNATVSPLQARQQGFFTGWDGTNGNRFIGYPLGQSRKFSPVVARFVNLAAQSPSAWTLNGGTLVTGILAPDGTTNAGRVTSSGGTAGVFLGLSTTRTFAVGDWVIAKVLVRSNTGAIVQRPAEINVFTSCSNLTLSQGSRFLGSFIAGNSEWQEIWTAMKIAGGGTNCALTFVGNTTPPTVIDYYAPTLIVIPAGTVSDNEAWEIAYTMSVYPETASVGDITMLRGQRFSMSGSTNFFAKMTHAMTADRVVTFPDNTGTVAELNLAESFTAIQTFTQQIVSSLATGTAPFSITSTTNVPNLNASSLSGNTFPAPGPIGGTTPGTAAFTTLSATGLSTLTGNYNVNVTPVTVSANVTTDQNLMSFTVPAGLLNSVGRTLRVWVGAVYSTPVASVATVTMKVKLGALTLFSATSSANPGTVTNNSINVTALSSTQTAGATASFEAHGNLVIDLGASPGLADSTFSDSNAATISPADTTGALTLQVTVAFSVASASNSCTQRQLVVEVLN